MKCKILDFHTHPYIDDGGNICMYKSSNFLTIENAKNYLQSIGISKICGSVIYSKNGSFDFSDVKKMNDVALRLKEILGDFYIPGFQIHPAFVEESVKEIERAKSLGINLIGEVVPYMHGWSYCDSGLDALLSAMDGQDMVFSYHSSVDTEKEQVAIDELIERHPSVTFVAAHPGEKDKYITHLERLKKYDNYYLDLSGTGLFRFGMLSHGIKTAGNNKFLFGTDFPICDPSMYVASVVSDPFLSEQDKENVLYNNAARLLKL